MTFANPAYLTLALILLPAFGLFMWWAAKRQKSLLARLGEAHLINRLAASVNWRGRRWGAILMLAALALILFSLARPQWGQEEQLVDQEGLQVIVALDVSKSMLAKDIKPSRLDRAKLEISDLMGRLNGDEIGLVLFSGASFIQVPLTTDYGTALNYLDSAGPKVISRPGTVIGDAILTALQGFDENLRSQKVLIVMTDGEDHESDPISAAQEAAGQGVLIYTIGFGTVQGESIPELNDRNEVVGYKEDQNGLVVISKLDEGALKSIAEIGGGGYFHAAPDGAELDELLTEIGNLQRASLESRLETRRIERYQITLALGFVALLITEFIPDRLGDRSTRRRFRRNQQDELPDNSQPAANG
jgi:Ca-activated chloride channel homolog